MDIEFAKYNAKINDELFFIWVHIFSMKAKNDLFKVQNEVGVKMFFDEL